LTSSITSRPDWEKHFFNRAKVVAEMSTCLRRKVGAIIVSRDNVELTSGYSGAPRKTQHCFNIGNCLRTQLKIPSGERHELCRSVHAEQNAIINAARTGVNIVGGKMYISSSKMKDMYDSEDTKDKVYAPCIICKKEIINAGLTEVHMREEVVGENTFTIEEIKELLALEEEGWRKEFQEGRLTSKEFSSSTH
jgi:dCMP deaminase